VRSAILRRVWKVAAALLLALLAGSCGGGPPERGTAVVDAAGGPVTFSVEIADDPAERRRGLMGREMLPPGAGMLFVFPEDVDTPFWMKDTLVPLSVAFLDGRGRIVAILDMDPCRADPCPAYAPAAPYRQALEVGLGSFARLGIEVGDVVRLER
jgi:uncharacterized membrane protein (UPF0127 family)